MGFNRMIILYYSGEDLALYCATCRLGFDSCWDLCQHCQTVHNLTIYQQPNNQSASFNSKMADSDAT